MSIETVKEAAVGIKERIAKALFGDVITQEIEKSSRQLISYLPGNDSSGVLPDIDFEIFNEMFEQTSWIRAVVGVICKAVTARGYSVIPTQPNADPKNAELLLEFFAGCNPNDTFVEILDDITRDVYVFGNAFIELVRDARGTPRELWNLDATTMRVRADEHGAIQGYVQVPRYATRGASQVDFGALDVIHLKLGTKGSTLYGLSPLVSLILPITVDKFAQIYNRAFFLNGAKIRGAFIMKDATPEQVERNREYLQARAKNPDLAHADLVLEGAIEFKQIGVNQKDMEFLQLREFTRNEILAVYGVPPSKVSIIETGNIGAGTGEQQTQTFYEETILPHQMRVAEKITKHIIRQGFGITDWAFQFNKRSIDEKDQAEIFNIYLQNGVYTPEEVRRLVAPRMPELEKAAAYEIKKKLSGTRQTIVMATRAVVALENRFVLALGSKFKEIKRTVAAKLPALKVSELHAKVSGLTSAYQAETLPWRFGTLKRPVPSEAIKAIDDLEVILESVDEQGIGTILTQFSLDAARLGLKTTKDRVRLKDVDDISRELEETLKAGAVTLASNISLSLKETLRQAILDGFSANESIPQIMDRIESQLADVATIQVGAVTDDAGNIIRAATTRQLSAETAAEMIARTEANRAFNAGNLDALRQAEVEKVQWLLASDACEECVTASEAAVGETKGKVMSIDEADGVLPQHPNCRCVIVVSTEDL
jgi:HK97 family phage portal protein